MGSGSSWGSYGVWCCCHHLRKETRIHEGGSMEHNVMVIAVVTVVAVEVGDIDDVGDGE